MAMSSTFSTCQRLEQGQFSNGLRNREESLSSQRPRTVRLAMVTTMDRCQFLRGWSRQNLHQNSSKQRCSCKELTSTFKVASHRVLRKRFRLRFAGMRFSEQNQDYVDGCNSWTRSNRWSNNGSTWSSRDTGSGKKPGRHGGLTCRCSGVNEFAASNTTQPKTGNERPKLTVGILNFKMNRLSASQPLRQSSSRSRVRTPEAAGSSAVAIVAVTSLVIAAAVALKNQVSEDEAENAEMQGLSSKTPPCESCGGSGLCATCNGDGFVMRTLSPEAADRARKAATTAATRFTAGLAKKWSYCPSCSGGRSCPVCQKRA